METRCMLLPAKALNCTRRHNYEQLLIFLKLDSAMLTSARAEEIFRVIQGGGSGHLSVVLSLQIFG